MPPYKIARGNPAGFILMTATFGLVAVLLFGCRSSDDTEPGESPSAEASTSAPTDETTGGPLEGGPATTPGEAPAPGGDEGDIQPPLPSGSKTQTQRVTAPPSATQPPPEVPEPAGPSSSG